MGKKNILTELEKVLKKHEVVPQREDDTIITLWTHKEDGRRCIIMFKEMQGRIVVNVITLINEDISDDVSLRAVNFANLHSTDTFFMVTPHQKKRILIGRTLSPPINTPADIENVFYIALTVLVSMHEVLDLMTDMNEVSILVDCLVPEDTFILP
ncbi:hypothetical protein DRQ20_02975 [bacterium]|nr:MAG: hypothetical protein DRQ20_02975 [bacterium]